MQIPADTKLRVGDVARLIGQSTDTVRRLADRGFFDSVKTGSGQRLITAGSVEVYLEWRARKPLEVAS